MTEHGSAAELGHIDADMDRIVADEERVLRRVVRTLEARRVERRTTMIDYDAELLALRDQITEARLEDVPPLIEEMERLQQVAARRAQVAEGHVDVTSPYFGRLVLEEDNKKREVLIGRGTFLDPTTGIRIVDWRDAPVSRIYYRYDEGDDYEESFGGRDVEGEVVTRRSLAIADAVLRRISTPQGTFLRTAENAWRRAGVSATRLSGGQGAAMRPESHHRPGRLGVGESDGREDKHLPEVTALIDPRQFELITRATSGLVVIQGGAGSGKTTIGLHRMAYLAFQDPSRFRADKMLIVVFNDALARYISRVLPALGVPGVPVLTYEKWAHRQRSLHFERMPKTYSEDTPSVVVRMKKHPVMLRLIDEHATALAERIDTEIIDTGSKLDLGGKVLAYWRSTDGAPIAQRVLTLAHWLTGTENDGEAQKIPLATRHAIERVLVKAREKTNVVAVWADVLTDRKRLGEIFARLAPGAFREEELDQAHAWCSRRCTEALLYHEEDAEPAASTEPRERDDEPRDDGALDTAPVDGLDDEPPPTLDQEDDTLLLRLYQRIVAPLSRKKEALRYEHIFVDEAQDLSPVELAVVLDASSKRKSVTLAGDTAQRLLIDNGFSDWRGVLGDLGLAHVEVEPLRLSYRSTHEIVEFGEQVLGPLRNEQPGQATRSGAPVELFRFSHSGDAVGFLGEALRELMQGEPRASVALIARYAEQADLYYRGLLKAEVPHLRRIAEQDFPFKAGIDVTDVRQVKGLEFDYVVLLEISTASYPDDVEARHLLHIAATRAAHQLWVTTTGTPSLLLPEALRARGY